MMYKVINRFKEVQHDYIYEVGEKYPATGKKLVKSRADFLTKPHVIYGVAFLEEVDSKKEEKKPSEKQEDEEEKSDA